MADDCKNSDKPQNEAQETPHEPEPVQQEADGRQHDEPKSVQEADGSQQTAKEESSRSKTGDGNDEGQGQSLGSGGDELGNEGVAGLSGLVGSGPSGGGMLLASGEGGQGEEQDSKGRSRKLTMKGKEFKAQGVQRALSAAMSKWRATASGAERATTDATAIEDLRRFRDDLEGDLLSVTNAARELFTLEPDEESKLASKIENMETKNLEILGKLTSSIRDLQHETSSFRTTGSRRSNRSRCSAVSLNSQQSQRSSGSSRRSSQRAAAAAEAAALEAKLQFVDVEAKQKAELEKTQTKMKLEMAKARCLAYDSDEDSVTFKLNPKATEFAPRPAKSTEATTQSQTQRPQAPPSDNKAWDNESFSKCFAEQMYINRIPLPEPGIFRGDPIDYPCWKEAYDTLIGSRRLPARERVHYLRRYLGGPARQAVEGFLVLATEDAYQCAMNLLEKRFGDPFTIAGAYRDKLEAWSRVPSRDGDSLRCFADYLQQCAVTMQGNSSLNVLNDERQNRFMLTKLPDDVSARWARYVANYRKSHGSFPKFVEFANFVSGEADIACDPVTKVPMPKTATAQEKPKRKPEKRAGTFSTNTSVTAPLPCCGMCKTKGHDLSKCKKFLELDLAARTNFIKENDLCFGCLKSGHRSRACRSRLKCDTCNKQHPSCLHREAPVEASANGDTRTENAAEEPTVRAHNKRVASKTSSAGKATMILPVTVWHRSDPGHQVTVYAMLDSQSDTTFILDKTRDELGVSGAKVRLLLSTLSAKDEVVQSHCLHGLMVKGIGQDTTLALPPTYTRHLMPVDRSHIPGPETARSWPYLQHIAGDIPEVLDADVGLLIGYNCTRALTPREVVTDSGDGPFAQRTDLGWGIVGLLEPEVDPDDPVGVSHRALTAPVDAEAGQAYLVSKVHVREHKGKDAKQLSLVDVSRMMAIDFSERESLGKMDDLARHLRLEAWSMNDAKFLDKVASGIKQVQSGHYEMPLPLKHSHPSLPDNKSYAMSRLQHLKRKLQRDPKLLQEYGVFMKKMIEQGHCEPAQDDIEKKGPVWYIPHHAVYHPKKPGKIRVVFDCSARYKGHSLNDYLFQGPDLINGLVGVLLRFRKETIGIMCDVEAMYHQFHVSPEHRDLLRFLWWTDGNLDTPPKTYRMTVHLFGAISSPACANFGLKRLAEDHAATASPEVVKFVQRDFYVDDGLRSVASVQEGKDLLQASQRLCGLGGLHLHKFASNSADVLRDLPKEDLAPHMDQLGLPTDEPVTERALGVFWNIKDDTLGFQVTNEEKPMTRRGILSVVSSLYDPLGLAAPVILVGKQILQDLCREGAQWDDALPEQLESKWQSWKEQLKTLEKCAVPRCYKPSSFGEVGRVELHHFADASLGGYGACSYIRLINTEGQVHCSLVMSKARVTPLKPVTVPRLELTAAVVAVRMSLLIEKELDIENAIHVFWSDSKVVLAYIANDATRFHTFVANRVQFIRNHSEPDQWNHIPTAQNPADIASRGCTADEIQENMLWQHGPALLWQPIVADEHKMTSLQPDDPEVKRRVLVTQVKSGNYILTRLSQFSSWTKMKRIVALCLQFPKESERGRSRSELCVQLLSQAETAIVKMVQSETYGLEIQQLQEEGKIPSAKPIAKLDPFLDDQGVLRVGGRLRQADMAFNKKHPALLPKEHPVTKALLLHLHQHTAHQGRGMLVSTLRNNGFWIVGASRMAGSLIHKCVTCRKLRGTLCEQRMADLPRDRLENVAPFTSSGVDYFGPFIIKEGRKEIKRWGVVFTCMASRAIHLDVAAYLSTDAFINVMRRFICLRGTVRTLKSDRGTNIVGASNELSKALHEINDERVKRLLLENGCDFTFNPPHASHAGGVWERQIRTVRSVLNGLLQEHGRQLDDDSLRTLMAETTAIVNSRPLSVDTLNDAASLLPISPNQLLMMKTSVVVPPPGDFGKADIYCKKRWRRVQHLANVFWARWKKEYILQLQWRNKWTVPRPNIEEGDVVLLQDDGLPRCEWRLGRVTTATPQDDGHVRTVRVQVGDPSLAPDGRRASTSYLERPIQKVVLIAKGESLYQDEE